MTEVISKTVPGNDQATLKERASGWVLQAKEKVGRISDKAVEHVQRHPYRSLAVAAGIGFVVGMLLKRR